TKENIIKNYFDLEKINIKDINLLTRLIKNKEEEFIGFNIKHIEKTLVKEGTMQKLKQFYNNIIERGNYNKQLKFEEILFERSINKLNRKEEMYTFMNRICKKFINTFNLYLKGLESSLDNNNLYKEVVKSIILLKSRTQELIIRHII